MALSLAEQRERALSPPTREQERAAAAERQIEADQARREQERLTKRREIRDQIKQRDKLQGDLALLADQLRELDRRADEAAARHTETTEPIQAKLADASGAQRDKLLMALTEANVQLERELDVLKRVRVRVQKRWTDVRSQVAELPTSQRLAGADLASQSNLAERFAADRRIRAAEQRVGQAREHLAALEPLLEAAKTTPVTPSMFGHEVVDGRRQIDLETVHVFSQRAARWRCEAVHAEAELHEAQQTLAELTRDAITE